MRHRHLFRWSIGLLLASVAWSSLGLPAVNGENTAANGVTTRPLTFAHGDVQLAGTLYLPAGQGPFPAAVVMHGSGPETREPYVPDAQMLAKGGIAAFIFDKRGTGASTGDWRRSSLDDLIGDGLAAIALVQRQPEIDPDQVGVIGSSQGAWMAPFMAARSSRVAFLVQITGAATPLGSQEMWATGNALHELGFSERAIRTTIKAFHLLYSSRGLIRRGILPLGDLWFAHYDPTLDPAQAWPDVRVPALVLYGGQDDTVPTETSLNIVRQALAAHGHPASRIVVFPDRGHALDGSARNQDAAYATLVTGWIEAATHGERLPDAPFSDAYTTPDGLRWFGIAARPTPWYARAGFQLSVIVAFLLTFVLGAIASLLPWIKFGGMWPRLALALTSAVDAFLLVGLLLVINYLLNADAASASPAIPLSQALFALAWVSVLLAVGMVYLWSYTSAGSGFARIVFAIVGLVGWGFVPFLAYWGLLGGRL